MLIGKNIKKLDTRGGAALEFCLVAVTLFMLMFAIIDLGRYAITMQSLNMLANAGARAWILCYQNNVVIQNQKLANCTGDLIPNDSDKQTVAPFLYTGGLTPKLTIAQGTNAIIVTVSLANFTMLVPRLWTFNTAACDPNNPWPCLSTSVPCNNLSGASNRC
jgi:hypothetical protein